MPTINLISLPNQPITADAATTGIVGSGDDGGGRVDWERDVNEYNVQRNNNH
jgi:hypothetical protein